jgi:hypothetical protein
MVGIECMRGVAQIHDASSAYIWYPAKNVKRQCLSIGAGTKMQEKRYDVRMPMQSGQHEGSDISLVTRVYISAACRQEPSHQRNVTAGAGDVECRAASIRALAARGTEADEAKEERRVACACAGA